MTRSQLLCQVGAATGAAAGSVASAFFHRHCSKFWTPPKSQGGATYKKIFRLAQVEHVY